MNHPNFKVIEYKPHICLSIAPLFLVVISNTPSLSANNGIINVESIEFNYLNINKLLTNAEGGEDGGEQVGGGDLAGDELEVAQGVA